MKKYKIGLHILVWLLVFLNDFLPEYLNNGFRSYAKSEMSIGTLIKYFLVCFGYLITHIVCFYTTVLLIGPYFVNKKWWKALATLFLLLIFIPLYRYFIEFHLFLPYLGFDNYFGKIPDRVWYIKNSIIYIFSGSFLYAIIYFVVNEWYNNNRKQKELEKENIKSELAFLKSQINPHFLFNTLNDIYALTYRQSPKAPDALLKLSELLRYMLKESDEQFGELQKEIDYLKNVIDLFQIGQKGMAFVNFDVDGSIDNHRIAPLILINFVENAFKHGVVDNSDQPITIKIAINSTGMRFYMHNQKNSDLKDKTGGIGLMNVKRRLALLYPNQHMLKIEDQTTTFTIDLTIKWN